MNVSMPSEIRRMVKQGAISTAALERDSVDDSAWVVRAVCEKLLREWEELGLGGPVPEVVQQLGSGRPERRSLAHSFGSRVHTTLSLAG